MTNVRVHAEIEAETGDITVVLEVDDAKITFASNVQTLDSNETCALIQNFEDALLEAIEALAEKAQDGGA